MREQGIPSIMTSHDEAMTMVREEQAEATAKLMTDVMADTPAWAKGLPVKSAGWVGNFYTKD